MEVGTGFGWRLEGLSVIRRTSLGGGVPTYQQRADVYEIDGRELLACSDATATSPWTRDYPPRYEATHASPSCSNGGNLTARVEDYARYRYNSTTNSFTVTQRDGTVYDYTSLAVLAGVDSTDGADRYRFARNTVWLLTRITDTQTAVAAPTVKTNQVLISYDFDVASNGYAYRPDQITYAGYKVLFGYEINTALGSFFPTSSQDVGRQRYHLRSVQVFNGTAKVRAYGLSYGASPLAGTRLLTTVTTRLAIQRPR